MFAGLPAKEIKMSQAKTVFSYMTLDKKRGPCTKGRVVEIDGKLVAEVAVLSDYKRASTRQSAAIFRTALAVARLQAGDEVVVWTGSRVAKGQYVRPFSDGEHIVRVTPSNEAMSSYVLPMDIAKKEGLWFTDGMPVDALIGYPYGPEQWIAATWRSFTNGQHLVQEFGDGRYFHSNRVHKINEPKHA
jgi:hypothetical protein